MKSTSSFFAILVMASVFCSQQALAADTEKKAAPECKALAAEINRTSRTALNAANDDKAAAGEALRKIFVDCEKYVHQYSCTKETWPWIVSSISLSNYCYQALTTEQRFQQQAAGELLKKSQGFQPNSGRQGPATSSKSAVQR